MIAAHDQVYYPGYGEAFFQGPYLQDLVRAIQKRIGPELARRASEAAERAAAAQQPNPGFQVAQPAQKPFDQNAEQAKREVDESERKSVTLTRCGNGPAKRPRHPQQRPHLRRR